MTDFLKAELVGKNKWRVLAIPFGGPFDGKDFDGEFFSRNTDIKPDWFDRRPLVWHHNLDETFKADPVLGTVDDLEEEEDGWWTTMWLDRSHRYWAQVNELLGKGKLYGSSGTMINFVKTDRKTGEILQWPYVEQTLTPTPSNILSRITAAKAVDHFKSANIGLLPVVRDMFLTDLDSHKADLQSDLSSDGDASADLTADGDDAAIQRLEMDPRRERAVRKLAQLAPRLEKLTTR